MDRYEAFNVLFLPFSLKVCSPSIKMHWDISLSGVNCFPGTARVCGAPSQPSVGPLRDWGADAAGIP